MKNKENAMSDYMDMIKRSWTWARLTEDERGMFCHSVHWADEQNVIIGTYRHRWMILHAMYYTLLESLGYHDNLQWREKGGMNNV